LQGKSSVAELSLLPGDFGDAKELCPHHPELWMVAVDLMENNWISSADQN